MADPVLLNTGRGSYRLRVVEQTASMGAGPLGLTLGAEYSGGLENFAFRCHIAAGLLEREATADGAAACARMAGWLETQFETVREAALKSIRSEHRLVEV